MKPRGKPFVKNCESRFFKSYTNDVTRRRVIDLFVRFEISFYKKNTQQVGTLLLSKYPKDEFHISNLTWIREYTLDLILFLPCY